MASLYGSIHVIDPEAIAQSWGRTNWNNETEDFIRLLGVWILFQACIAVIVPLFIKDINMRYYITVAHMTKNLGAFILRYKCGLVVDTVILWDSESQYSQTCCLQSVMDIMSYVPRRVVWEKLSCRVQMAQASPNECKFAISSVRLTSFDLCKNV